MPATKTAKRRTTKSTAKRKPAKAAQRRTMTATHKKALAEGRNLSAVVERYMRAVNTPKKRGRKVSKASLVARLAKGQDTVRKAEGIEKLLAAQSVRDLKVRLAQAPASPADLTAVEREFVKIAKRFSDARGITYGAWRDAGVSAEVLRKAGIPRTRTTVVV